MSTVIKDLVKEYFNGDVRIYEMKSFADDRGSLIELWREDDEYDARMSYWSETNPFFMRGPHEHREQTDLFISYKSQMMYIFYNSKNVSEKEVFITEADKVYGIYVKPGIIHGYRNISTEVALTGNFPDQLWRGYGKVGEIDEIRHEVKIEGKPIVVILGAKGRLGRAMTKKFLSEMSIDGVQVIPFFGRIPVFQSQSINDVVEKIMRVREYQKAEDVYVINCIGKTDVGLLENESVRKEAFWVNVDLPFLLGEKLTKNGMKFMHFSSDYVYQRYMNEENEKKKKKGVMKQLSVYTQTKKRYEDLLDEVYNKNIPQNLVVVRVSNLFSVDINDQMNLLMKLWRKMSRNMVIEYDPQQEVGLTDVDHIAEWAYDVVRCKKYFNGRAFINLRSPGMTIGEIVNRYFGGYKHMREKMNEMNNWFNEFCNDEKVELVDLPSSDASIRKYLELLPPLKVMGESSKETTVDR